MNSKWRLRLVTILGACLACAAMVYREDTIRFSHRLHVKEQGISCDSCHKEVAAKEPGLPREGTCLECHDRDNCGQCHTNPKQPRSWAKAVKQGVIFSHPAHLKATEGRCEPCHEDVAQRQSPRESGRLIPHDACMTCHRSEYRKTDCRKCHPDLAENPARPTSFFNHDADFVRRHASLAQGDEQVCAHCHRQSFCADCHGKTEVLRPSERQSERVDKPLIHRGDYVTRHAIEARLDPNSCARCHTQRQCVTCHEARRVAPGRGGAFTHGMPAREWASENPADPNRHKFEARMGVASCAQCHDRGPETNCIRCHKVGGPGGRPHDDMIGSRKDPMCRWCHKAGGP